eukprot:2386809-Prymnesium_polylepis.1
MLQSGVYTHAEFRDGRWELSGSTVVPLAWSFTSPIKTSVPYTELPPPRAPLTLRDDAQALACLRERVPDGLAAPAMCGGYVEAIAAVVREMTS